MNLEKKETDFYLEARFTFGKALLTWFDACAGNGLVVNRDQCAVHYAAICAKML